MLSMEDVQAALALVGATASITSADRFRLLEGLARIVEADGWVFGVQHGEGQSCAGGSHGMLAGGALSEAGALPGTILCTCFGEIAALGCPIASQPDGHATFARFELLGDAAWYASTFYRSRCEPFGVDDLLLSLHPVEPGVRSEIRMHRQRGRAPFGVRERDLVHAVSGAVAWLHRADLHARDRHSFDKLSRREREVLSLLLSGHGRKQIAAELRLSEHTVGDYAKEIYRHFAVHSRGQLLARLLPGNGGLLAGD